jgi:membrane fusion protein
MRTTGVDALSPFLDESPPVAIVRSLSTILLLLFAAGLVALFVVHVPETVSASFSLESRRGADPIRTLHPGVVSELRVADAQVVASGDVLFVVSSEVAGDRESERQTVGMRLAGGQDRLGNERVRYENQARADQQEQRRLEQRLAALDRQVVLKEQQLTLTRDVAERHAREFEAGLISWLDANRPKLQVDELAGEVEKLRADIVDARGALDRLAYEIASRRAGFTETERAVREDLNAFQVRRDALDRDALGARGALSIAAPCAGTVVTLHVRQRGAVVDENELLAEIVCADEPLHAELVLPERGMALTRVGQAVKLLYDAFPYQRYGVQYGTLSWISPASTASAQGATFRAFVDLASGSVDVQGRPQAVLPGMRGRAAVIVGRRSLASYAIEPLRQLRESMVTTPPGPGQAMPQP